MSLVTCCDMHRFADDMELYEVRTSYARSEIESAQLQWESQRRQVAFAYCRGIVDGRLGVWVRRLAYVQ